MCKVPLKYRNKGFKSVPDGKTALLGSYDCECMGLVKKVDMVDETSSVNDSQYRQLVENRHPKLWHSDAVLSVTHTFSVTEGATGVIYSAKRVAYAKREAIKNELE